MTRSAIAVSIIVLVVTPSFAQTTWYVDDDNCPGPGVGTVVDPFCSIQNAIDAAGSGDTVVVEQGTYFEAINFNGKAITIESTNPGDPSVVQATIIDGAGHDHVVTCMNGEGPDTIMRGFVITGGHANGGGIHSVGGGMFLFESIPGNPVSPTVSDCAFVNNRADNCGGGVYVGNGSPTFSRCSFSGNIAGDGGGMCNQSTSGAHAITVTDCAFTYNQATFSCGGGIANVQMSTVITKCTFIGNSAANTGGAITNQDGEAPIITQCCFSLNAATTGGAIASLNGSNPNVAASAFCGNTPTAITGVFTDGGGNTFLYCPGPPTDPCPADINGDGVVGVPDLLLLLGSWGVCPG